MTNNNNWFRNNWLVLSIIGVLLGLGVAWGVTQNQQRTNTAEIEKKLDKEVFEIHTRQQTTALNEIKTALREQRAEWRSDIKEIKKLIKDGHGQ